MATYPTGVYAPASKSAGMTVQASFFNDPEAEITAVEDALKNGIQHAVTVASGGLTVSSGGLRVTGASSITGTLQVTGNSTVTGSLSVSGNSTFDGSLTVTGGLTAGGAVFGARIPSARVSLAAATSTFAMGASYVGVNWTTNDYDSTGLHSTAVNSSRIALTSSGIWTFGGQVVHLIPNSTSRATVRVLLNDADVLAGFERGGNETSTQLTVPVSGVYLATSTTAYLTVQTRFIGGNADGTMYGSTGAGHGPTHFWVQKVSA